MQSKLSNSGKVALTFSQHRIAVAIKLSVIAVAVLVFYLQDLSMVFKGALTDESTFHVLAIPFIFGYLLFRKRKMFNATLQPSQTSKRGLLKYFSLLTGITLCTIAILTYWYGSYTFTPLEIHMLTLPFLSAGLILILFNTATLRQLIFPIAFLIFLTPPPSEILFGVGSSLASISAAASNTLTNAFGMHAVLSANNIGPLITLTRPDQTTIAFTVDVACSGIYSLIGFAIFALFIAYIMRGKLWGKLAIVTIGIPLIMVLNIVRITSILAIGYNYGETLALQVFHTVGATVLMFIGTLLLLAVTEKAFKKPKPPQPCPTCSPTQKNLIYSFCESCGKLLKSPQTKLTKADISKIFGIAFVIIVLLTIQAPVFALTQGPAEISVQTPTGTQTATSSAMFPSIIGYNLSYLYRDTAYEQTSGVDEALVYSYTSSNREKPTVWVALQIAPSVTSEHRWETCLINYPLSQGLQTGVNQLDLRDVQLQDNPPITARYFAFQYKNTNQTQVVLYWYQTATFNTNSSAEQKSVMISLIMYPSSPQNVSEAENQQLLMAQAINNYWQPIQTWSTVALAISQNGLSLSLFAGVILVILVFYAYLINRQEKSQTLILYEKLPEQDKMLIKAVNNATKQQNPTTEGIAGELQKLTLTVPDRTWLTEKLDEAERIGLIQKALANRNDQPAFVWKSLVSKFNISFKIFLDLSRRFHSLNG